MTLCAIILSLLLVFLTPSIHFDPFYLMILILVGSTSVFLATIFLNTFILIPLEYLDQKLIPNLVAFVRQDRPLRLGRVILFFFVLVSYFFLIVVSRLQNIQFLDWFFLAWMIFFGIALDILHDSWRRFTHFLSPSFLVSEISNKAEKAIQNDQRTYLLNDLDTLSEIALRSVEKSKLSLSNQTLQAFPPLLKTYFDSSKSISHISRDLNAPQNVRGGDEPSFMIFYVLQRFELIYDKALRERQETVCRQMMMIMGKIILHCAQFDLSMVSFPTHFLTKFGLKAQQHHFDEVAVMTTSTLLEIGKTILAEIEITYAELQEPFQAIINGLTALARATFKKQKDTNIKVLVQPLIDLKKLFQTDKMASHRDTPIIIQQIDNVLEEFTTLEQVMQTIPSIPEMEAPESLGP